MNINGFSFEIFRVPHTARWTVIVKDKGVRINAPFLVECGVTIEEACNKVAQYCNAAVHSENFADMMNVYENRHRGDAG